MASNSSHHQNSRRSGRSSQGNNPADTSTNPFTPLGDDWVPIIQESSSRISNTPSATIQERRGRSQSLPFVTGSNAEISESAIRIRLAAGPTTVIITNERERSNANPNKPAFLMGVSFDANHSEHWTEIVLPHTKTLTFVIASSTDMHFAGAMLRSAQLPQLYLAITKLELPGFYWFGGVVHNRLHNPYIQIAKHLSNLRELTFRLHTAGITTSAFGERQMLMIERTDPKRAKERRCMRITDVVHKYEIEGLLQCTALQRIRIEYIECAMTRHFCRVGNPINVLQGIQTRLIQNFARQGQRVAVELVSVSS